MSIFKIIFYRQIYNIFTWQKIKSLNSWGSYDKYITRPSRQIHFNDFFITCTAKEVREIVSNPCETIFTFTQACVGEFNEFQCEIIIGSLT